MVTCNTQYYKLAISKENSITFWHCAQSFDDFKVAPSKNTQYALFKERHPIVYQLYMDTVMGLNVGQFILMKNDETNIYKKYPIHSFKEFSRKNFDKNVYDYKNFIKSKENISKKFHQQLEITLSQVSMDNKKIKI